MTGSTSTRNYEIRWHAVGEGRGHNPTVPPSLRGRHGGTTRSSPRSEWGDAPAPPRAALHTQRSTADTAPEKLSPHSSDGADLILTR